MSSLPGDASRSRIAVRLGVAVALFLGVVAVGTVGYVAIAGVSVWDALYMTVITVFAVGFAETIPLDGAGRGFTLFVIVAGVGGFTFLTVTVIEFLVEGHLVEIVGRRRMSKQLADTSDHAIVAGFGRVGRQVADDLTAGGRTPVVVDLDPERLALATLRDLPWVHGDASTEHVLEQAGLERARAIAACTDDDAENILICLTAKGIRPDLFVVVRVKDGENSTKAHRAGADRVIAPAEIGGHRIAALLTRPNVVEFLDIVTHGSEVDLVLEEVVIGARSSIANRTLAQAGLRDHYGLTVLSVRRAGSARIDTHPRADTVLHAGDVLVVLGARADLDRLERADIIR